MEKNIKEISSSLREVEFILTAEDVQPHFDEAYKKAQPHIDMKGFRKGKVPMNLIKKQYGKAIEFEALEDIANKTFNEFLTADSIPMVGTPQLVNIDKKDDGFIFVIKFEIIPDIQLADYRGIVVDEPVHPVTDEEIEQYVLQVCKSNGKFEEAEQVTDEEHVVDVSIQEIDEATQVPLLGNKSTESKLYLADQYVMPEMKANLLNTKVEDSFTFKPNLYDPNAPDNSYRVTVKKIEKLIPAEFTNEFVETYTKGKFKSTEEFREDTGFKLQENWNEKTRKEIENQLIGKIVEMNDFEPPATIVEEVIEAMANDLRKQYNITDKEKLQTKDMVDGLRPLAVRTVKWEIIRNQIMKNEKIEVEEYDIEDIVNAEVERTKGDATAIAKKLKQNPQIINSIINKKVMDFIIDFAVTEEIPFEDYANKSHEEHNHDLYDDYEEHDHDRDHEHEHHDHDHEHHDHAHHHEHEHHHHDHEHKH